MLISVQDYKWLDSILGAQDESLGPTLDSMPFHHRVLPHAHPHTLRHVDMPVNFMYIFGVWKETRTLGENPCRCWEAVQTTQTVALGRNLFFSTLRLFTALNFCNSCFIYFCVWTWYTLTVKHVNIHYLAIVLQQ